MTARLAALLPDKFLLALLATIAFAVLYPVTGETAATLKVFSKATIALLFFLYGARLHYSAIIEGLTNWRLQLASLLVTFVIFPLLGWAMAAGAESIIDPALIAGFVFLTLLPSTVQSSIAMVGVARGNVAAAICCASLSNMAGVFFTPMLALVLMDAQAGDMDAGAAIGKVALQILLPFIIGMMCQRPLAGVMAWFGSKLKLYDRAVILLIGYIAISAAITGGVFAEIGLVDLVLLGVLFLVLLVLAMGGSWLLAGALGMNMADRIALLFCGSQKSLASGVPLAAALFPASAAGVIIVPVIVYHQMQLVIGTVLCGRLARHGEAAGAVAA